MSLPDLYQRFLADPRSASLASDVSLIYIPTTTKVDSADAVRSHLSKQQTVVKTKAQDVLGVVELARNRVLDVIDQFEDIAAGHDASGGHRNAARFFHNGAQFVERFKYSVHGYTLHASFHCYQCAWCDCCDRAS